MPIFSVLLEVALAGGEPEDFSSLQHALYDAAAATGTDDDSTVEGHVSTPDEAEEDDTDSTAPASPSLTNEPHDHQPLPTATQGPVRDTGEPLGAFASFDDAVLDVRMAVMAADLAQAENLCKDLLNEVLAGEQLEATSPVALVESTYGPGPFEDLLDQFDN